MKKKKNDSVCKIRNCGGSIHGGGLCVKHYRRKWRKDHPIKAAYANLKMNAKRRGKIFKITFPQFCQFAIKQKLFMNKGRELDSYTIDRIDNEKGYEIGNVQVLTFQENRIKGKRLEYDWKHKYAVMVDQSRIEITDTPF